MELDPQTVQQFSEVIKGIDETLADIRKTISSGSSPKETGNASSSINLNVNAGSSGLRIATTLCIVMFVMMVFTIGFSLYTSAEQNATIARLQSSSQKKMDRMQDYLNIILQWSPELRKQVEQKEQK